MKNCFKLFLISFVLFGLQACNRRHDGSISLSPYSLNLEPPPGPPEYQKGWDQGCESGQNAYSRTFYKMIRAFDYEFDAKLRDNKMYYQAWKDAYLYCAIFLERVNTLTP